MSNAGAATVLRFIIDESLPLLRPASGWKFTRQCFVRSAAFALIFLIVLPMTAASQTAPDRSELRGNFERRVPGVLSYELLPSFTATLIGGLRSGTPRLPF